MNLLIWWSALGEWTSQTLAALNLVWINEFTSHTIKFRHKAPVSSFSLPSIGESTSQSLHTTLIVYSAFFLSEISQPINFFVWVRENQVHLHSMNLLISQISVGELTSLHWGSMWFNCEAFWSEVSTIPHYLMIFPHFLVFHLRMNSSIIAQNSLALSHCIESEIVQHCKVWINGNGNGT